LVCMCAIFEKTNRGDAALSSKPSWTVPGM
jgi:hypothetical protein